MEDEVTEDREINLELGGGDFQILLRDGLGSINSNLHFTEEEWQGEFGDFDGHEDREEFVRYEAAIDAIESLLLGMAMSGVDVEAKNFKEGLQTALDAISNNM